MLYISIISDYLSLGSYHLIISIDNNPPPPQQYQSPPVQSPPGYAVHYSVTAEPQAVQVNLMIT